jgi:(p)ppGpp synthase/HD superfamily hydrolase
MPSAHLTRRFTEAVDYAVIAHAGQVRKGTDLPYVSHLLTVAATVLDDGGSEDEAIAGLLHDVVEDQGEHEDGGRARLADVRSRFGDAVAEIVDGCTDFEVGAERAEWRPRKEAAIAHIAAMSPSVRRVSLADKLHNARAILRDLRRHGDAVWARFNAGRAEQLWYHRALADAYAEVSDSPLVDDLLAVVEELEARAG